MQLVQGVPLAFTSSQSLSEMLPLPPVWSPQESQLLLAGNRTSIYWERDGQLTYVKKRLRDFAHVERERQSLYREAHLQACARGPGVVAIAGGAKEESSRLLPPTASQGEYGFLLRQAISGSSLRERLTGSTTPALTQAQVRSCAHQLLDRLQHLQQVTNPETGAPGLMHLDLTPDNLLLDEEGTLWLNDFGLARFADEPPLTEDQLLCGTPAFLCPEVLRGEQPSSASDVFQCGLLCLLLLRPALYPQLRLRASRWPQRSLDPLQLLSPVPSWLRAALEEEPRHRPQIEELRALFSQHLPL